MKGFFAFAIVILIAALVFLGSRGVEPASQDSAQSGDLITLPPVEANDAPPTAPPSFPASPSSPPHPFSSSPAVPPRSSPASFPAPRPVSAPATATSAGTSFFQSIFPPNATPHPAAQARIEAVRRYPALAVKDSAINRAFLDHYDKARIDEPKLLTQPDWPTILAARAAYTKPVTPTPKPAPTRDEDLWTDPEGLNFEVDGLVGEVHANGILLLYPKVSHPAMIPVVTYTNPLDGSKQYVIKPGIKTTRPGMPIFVYGVRSVADGEIYKGKVCPAGIYGYDTTEGRRTVRAYATSTRLAERLGRE